ncbi:MAG: glycosyltransferase 87 family protein [Litorimonas sp.]
MKTSRPALILCALAILLAGALFVIRWITPEFASGLLTAEHPVILLCLSLIIAGIAWMGLVFTLRKNLFSKRSLLAALLLLGLGLRFLFFGSTPVYENDYKRYLWDGSVVASGENPYRFSPSEVFEAGEVGARSVPDLTRLALRSNDADYITGEINSPKLTTIYPPAAQAVFAVAYWISPYEKWGLKLVFLIIELLGLAAMLAGLRSRNLPMLWSAAYWLNPIIIFTTYNGLHMDVLLIAPLMVAVLWVGRHPVRAALMLSLAAAIKIWPLLLAPVLFRKWRHRPVLYLCIAALIGSLTIASLAPMLLSLHSDSGLAAYSANWTNSSFLFPGLRDGLGLVLDNPDRIARYVVALTLTGLSLWLGFIRTENNSSIPAHLMVLSAAFVLLSPTGYPWYFIWFLMFLPFALNHWSARGLALLTIGAAAYFARFKIGEAGHYDIYAKVLLPLEFGIPLLVLVWDGLKAKRYA